MKTLIFSLLLVLGSVSVAHADCYYDGTSYPAGTRIGPLVCQADGTWESQ
jgi:hypothetical protein